MNLLVILGKRLKDDGSFHADMYDRCLKAIEFLQSVNCEKILLCGGYANPKAGISEAYAMQKFLEEKGINKEKIILEAKSLTTKQNAAFSAPIINNLGTKTIFICTSKNHLRRFYLNPLRLFKKYLDDKVIIKGI